jgi:hypothetical protein
MKRIYFHYKELEEWRDGMWKIVGGEARKLNAINAANLMRDACFFEKSMMRVLEEWPNSCQQNLSAADNNRIAWLGQAGCFLEASSPEENTRFGWHMLNTKEQEYANKVAQKVLDLWVEANTDELPLFMGIKNA